jgi:hypothetical protein
MERLFNEYGVPDMKKRKEVIDLIARGCFDLTDKLWREVVERQGICHRDLRAVVEDYIDTNFIAKRLRFGVESRKRHELEKRHDQDQPGHPPI